MPLVDQKRMLIDGERAFIELSHFKMDGCFFINEACYSQLNLDRIDELVVFFFKTSELQKEYVKWVINDSCWSHAYITKDVDEGFDNGFYINAEYCGKYNDLLDALRFIRVTNEYKKYIRRKRKLHTYMQAIRDLPYTAVDHCHIDIHLPNTLDQIRKDTT